MLIADLITHDIPALKPADTIEQALDWMEEFKVEHLPVLSHKSLAGIVSESDLMALQDNHGKIGDHQFRYLRPIIHPQQHAFDALKLMSGMHLTLIPVLDDNDNYMGSVTQKSVLDKIAGFTSVMEQGGIIELELNKNDYSLTQIASIVEGNDAKILSCYVTSTPDSNKIEVTLKINREELSRILQTFNRYNYTVKASYHQAGYEDDLKTRFDEFMRFLNI
ncbi:MAG TPA: CBS domain-containing protein [Bacteroidia bacterium]|jgi:acetoin utilization protein AcuB|nr:CBS domain-containing protein [Bacteroidia bacterium]